MRERQLIPIEVAGSAISSAVRLLLEDPDIAEVFGWLRPEPDARQWSGAEDTRLFAVAERGSGIIGLAALSDIRREERSARLSCAVAAPYRLSGAGHWAATEAIRRGVRLEDLRHVDAYVREGHDTARRVLESLGFRARQEGAPEGHLHLRLDLPNDSRGHFLMAPAAVPHRASYGRAASAALSA
ncbi:GNAT family N-acetyltransferase [Pyxidicoccus fallax]|uniref:GNAT family N-acetyltransferase n=1 Tax=Pyxidicoccus fallax TaxID=394095 RepID=A0A848LCU1_9BACT|nr:GNAT family N-acetyltransferase [Pyxidicoccus fallax]NMO16497.1 GNAT family N-acetyltransferase [Pyxidicoccus fallax]NPC77441.1 GNAT family N-acetyltransferase [Pyxidicoccus fallax]